MVGCSIENVSLELVYELRQNNLYYLYHTGEGLMWFEDALPIKSREITASYNLRTTNIWSSHHFQNI